MPGGCFYKTLGLRVAIRMNGHTFMGSHSGTFIYVSLPNGGQLLQENKFLLLEKILSFKCRSIHCPGEQIKLKSHNRVTKVASL